LVLQRGGGSNDEKSSPLCRLKASSSAFLLINAIWGARRV
jgi:hypothetical protein